MSAQQATEIRLWHMRDREERQRQLRLTMAMILLTLSGFTFGLVAGSQLLAHFGHCQLP